ncbi:hypothetical protein AB5I41_24900 [Sphingomonas sp. MMS24-JH45]
MGDDWVELENTQPDYAAGLSLWQHRQVRAWAKRQALELNTAAERLAARDDLNRFIRETFKDMDARERRAMARMMGAGAAKPAYEVEYAEAEPRHDGMGLIIEHDVPAQDREDAQRPHSRPSNQKDDDADAETSGADLSDSGEPDNEGDDPLFAGAVPPVEPSPLDEDDLEDEEYL